MLRFDRWTSYCRSLLVLILGIVATASIPALGQEAQIALGASWLQTDQNTTGLWGEDSVTPYRDTSDVLLALIAAGGDTNVIDSGRQALEGFPHSSVDRIARRLVLDSMILGGSGEPSFLTDLTTTQNGDGGWGFTDSYKSNVFDTSLALRSLRIAGLVDPTPIGNAALFLSSSQNTDGGWPFVSGGSSELFFTIQAMLALGRIQGDVNVSAELASALAWLETKVRPDGGLGDVASTAHETGMAIAAMIKADVTSPAIAGAQSYLLSTQLPDGSWESNAFSTAWAVYGLVHVGADLGVGSSDIVLSNLTPSDDETVTISVTVHNRGLQGAGPIQVQVYDGDPDYVVIHEADPDIFSNQIGADLFISHLDAGADSAITLDWNTAGLAGDRLIYALVDSDDTITEPDNSDNTAIKPIHVYYPPDLLIEVADIQFTPETPETTDNVTITTTIHNYGELTASNVTLQIYDGNPDSGGIPMLGPFTFPSPIAAGSLTSLDFNVGNHFNTEGGHLITAVADVANAIREASETNNRAEKTLWVGVRCEPMPLAGDLNLIGLPITPSSSVTSYTAMASIDNSLELHGWDPVTQSWQSAFDLGGGTILGDDFNIGLMQGFFARTSTAGNATFCGTFTTVHDCVDLLPGLNLVSVSHPAACYSGYHFLDSITDCDEAYAWDGGTQSWLTAIDTGGGVPAGDDFTVSPGGGYFVKVGAGGPWCTIDCDTVSALPDLVVTAAGIYLNPNPTPSGGSVEIYVNVANAGTVAAVEPRMDFYLGDPGTGGTPLAAFIIPETIPAGGATASWWGNTFTINGSGSVDIYAVVDMYDDIPELDNTNNKDFKTLVFSGSVAQPLSQQVVPGGDIGPSVALIQPGRLPDSRAPTAPRPSSAISATVAVAQTASAADKAPQAVTEIAGILAANASSSAATIYWATDDCADGLIDYGLTTALGTSTIEEGICSDVHAVTLTGLLPATTYYYQIVSGGLTDNNAGAFHTFVTSTAGAGVPGVITGQVVDEATASPLAEVLVWMQLQHAGDTSLPLAAKTDLAGTWLVNLGNFKSVATGAILPWADGDQLTVDFLKPGLSFATQDTALTGASPQDLGIMTPQPSGSAVEDQMPLRPYLASNYPNPFNPSTTISFGLTRAGTVDLAIYDVSGRRVVTLVQEQYPAGRHDVVWYGRDKSGRNVASGVYFYRLKTDEITGIKKMLLVK